MRYMMRLSFNGTNYHGWQIQPHDTSVQQVLEQALAMVLRAPTPLTGAGRTDAGVNARTMVAHFDTAAPIANPALLAHKLNGIVGRDIAVHHIQPVVAHAHARFDATSRTYKYFVHTAKSPFLPFSLQLHPVPDFELMNRAAAMLLDVTDFTSFSKLHTDVKTNNCRVTHARWTMVPDEPERWVFTITADRFLRNMVRAVVGTLLDVGQGRITLEQFAHIVAQKDRCKAGQSMPGNALFLWDVTYPYSIG